MKFRLATQLLPVRAGRVIASCTYHKRERSRDSATRVQWEERRMLENDHFWPRLEMKHSCKTVESMENKKCHYYFTERRWKNKKWMQTCSITIIFICLHPFLTTFPSFLGKVIITFFLSDILNGSAWIFYFEAKNDHFSPYIFLYNNFSSSHNCIQVQWFCFLIST